MFAQNLNYRKWFTTFISLIDDTLMVTTNPDKSCRGCRRGLMVKALACGIVVSEFELQSRYYVHFRKNTLGKHMKPLILPAMG